MRLHPSQVVRASGLRHKLLGGINSDGDISIGNIIFTDANPNPSDYIDPDGSLINAASYPGLAALGFHNIYDLQNFSYRLPGDAIRRVMLTGNGNELLSLNRYAIYTSNDNGITWSNAGKAHPTDSQIRTALTESTYVRHEPGDIIYDPVSSTYLYILKGVATSDGGVTEKTNTQVYYSSDLSTWTHLFNANDKVDGGASYADFNTTLRLQRDKDGNCWMGGIFGRMRKKAAGLPLNVAAGWDQKGPVELSAGTRATFQILINDVFVHSNGGDGVFYTSLDGETWTERTVAGVTLRLTYAGYHAGKYFLFFNGQQGGSPGMPTAAIKVTEDFVTYENLNIDGITAFHSLFTDAESIVITKTNTITSDITVYQSTDGIIFDKQQLPVDPTPNAGGGSATSLYNWDTWYRINNVLYATSPASSSTVRMYRFNDVKKHRVPTVEAMSDVRRPFWRVK